MMTPEAMTVSATYEISSKSCRLEAFGRYFGSEPAVFVMLEVIQHLSNASEDVLHGTCTCNAD